MWRWLYTELRSAIIDGRLKSGARLPSTRNLAAQYGLARGTVVAAFQQLQAEGFVSSEVSAGTFVVPAPGWERNSPTKQRSARQVISKATIAKRTQSLLTTTFFFPHFFDGCESTLANTFERKPTAKHLIIRIFVSSVKCEKVRGSSQLAAPQAAIFIDFKSACRQESSEYPL